MAQNLLKKSSKKSDKNKYVYNIKDKVKFTLDMM